VFRELACDRVVARTRLADCFERRARVRKIALVGVNALRTAVFAPNLLVVLLALAGASGTFPNSSAAQDTGTPRGVTHELAVSFMPEPRFGTGSSFAADVTISVRIVDYAPDSRFFSTISARFLDTDPPDRVIWADEKCHIDRGLPKIWLLAADGTIGRGASVSRVSARPRTIGQHLPADEIILQKQNVRQSTSGLMRALSMMAVTTGSGLQIKLTLMTQGCAL
jgi:hypothetical protein